jgi:hypothetical protein
MAGEREREREMHGTKVERCPRNLVSAYVAHVYMSQYARAKHTRQDETDEWSTHYQHVRMLCMHPCRYSQECAHVTGLTRTTNRRRSADSHTL